MTNNLALIYFYIWHDSKNQQRTKTKFLPFIHSSIFKDSNTFLQVKTTYHWMLHTFLDYFTVEFGIFDWLHYFFPKDSLSSWNMSKTFLIGTGDIFDLLKKGWETIFEDNCEDLSVCAMALSPSSKFMESSSNELVSIFSNLFWKLLIVLRIIKSKSKSEGKKLIGAHKVL